LDLRLGGWRHPLGHRSRLGEGTAWHEDHDCCETQDGEMSQIDATSQNEFLSTNEQLHRPFLSRSKVKAQ
jgi:hypothetical protein